MTEPTKPDLTVGQQFEEWAKLDYGYPFPLELAKVGLDYEYLHTRFAWMTWQASRRRTLEEVIAKLRADERWSLKKFADELEAELNSKERL